MANMMAIPIVILCGPAPGSEAPEWAGKRSEYMRADGTEASCGRSYCSSFSRFALFEVTVTDDKRQTHKSKRGNRMTRNSSAEPSRKRNALLAIAVGGGIAGALDLTQACILFGWDVPLAIAGGLLGPQAFKGGAGTYVLGVVLHFFIACSAAATYYAASRRLPFLREYPLVCGLFFGAAVEEVMNLVVLPLSALHAKGPYTLHDLILGVLVHMVVIGLPISYSVRWFAKLK